MSVTVEFTLIDRGREAGKQICVYDNLQQAAIDQNLGMDLFSKENPMAKWVSMRVINE